MRNLIIYSDNDSFAGCENIVSVLLNDISFTKQFNTTFFFRSSKLYSAQLSNRLNDVSRAHPIPLLALRRSKLPSSIRNNLLARGSLKALSILCYPIIYIINFCTLYISFYRLRGNYILINNGGYPGADGCLQAAIISRFMGFSKVFMIVNNSAENRKFFTNKLSKIYDQIIFYCVDKFITGSEPTGLILKQRRQLSSKKIHCIPNGIDKARFNAEYIYKRRNKRYFGNEIITFSIIGLHEERKGHLILLKAISDLLMVRNDLSKRLKVLVEGCGDLTNHLKAYVEKHNLIDVVNFIGQQNEISKLYSITDVLVHPSLFFEDLPNVISEAMLFGIPTIGSRIAGIPSQIDHQVNGFLFSPGNSYELSKYLELIICNPEMLNDLSIASVNKFNTCFDSNIAIQRYKDLMIEKDKNG